MADDCGNQMAGTPLPAYAEPPYSPSVNILDALDMADVGEIDIRFERSSSHLRPAIFD